MFHINTTDGSYIFKNVDSRWSEQKKTSDLENETKKVYKTSLKS